MKVLLVSKNKIFEDTVSFLNTSVADVHQARSFDEALKVCSQQKFDICVLFDNFESSTQTLEFIEKFKSKHKNVPLVFIAYTQDSASRAQLYGADESITLPFMMNKPKDFLKQIVERFAQREFEREPYFKEEREEKRAD